MRFSAVLPLLAACVGLTLAAGLAIPGRAAEVPFWPENYSRYIQDEDLREVLRNFASTQGVRVVVSDKVQGMVSGRFEDVTPKEFFEGLARAYNLTWFYDGSTLYVNSGDEIETRVLQVPGVPSRRIARTLNQLGIAASEASLRAADSEKLLYLSGPPRYVALVEDVVKKLAAGDRTEGEQTREEPAIEIFPLKYAWAYDLKFDYRDSQVTVPGVATSLQSLLATSTPPNTGRVETQNRETLTKLKGTGLAARGAAAEADLAAGLPPGTAATRTAATTTTTVTDPSAAPAPVSRAPSAERLVQADVRLNSVIVRDSRDRIPLYAKVIRSLDVPVEAVEINAAVIDVNTSVTRALGNEFFLSKKIGNGRIQFGNASPAELTNVTTTGTGTTTTTGGTTTTGTSILGNANTLLGGAASGLTAGGLVLSNGLEFLNRIQALEENGKARIQSRPSVMTLDNVEAAIRNDRTFYVRVAGSYNVDLFNVSAGTELKVIPHVVNEGGRRKIKLVLNISDGAVSGDSVDSIPVIQQSKISTQAVIYEGQSLLIGGYYRDEDSRNDRAIPGLGRIPLLGYLFKTENRVRARAERMFLVTPKIVNLSYGNVPADAKSFLPAGPAAAAGGKNAASTARPVSVRSAPAATAAAVARAVSAQEFTLPED